MRLSTTPPPCPATSRRCCQVSSIRHNAQTRNQGQTRADMDYRQTAGGGIQLVLCCSWMTTSITPCLPTHLCVPIQACAKRLREELHVYSVLLLMMTVHKCLLGCSFIALDESRKSPNAKPVVTCHTFPKLTLLHRSIQKKARRRQVSSSSSSNAAAEK